MGKIDKRYRILLRCGCMKFQIDDVWSLGLVPRKVGATFHSMPYGGIKGFFDPFLNGSVIAQDFKRQEEGLYLFTQVNGKLL